MKAADLISALRCGRPVASPPVDPPDTAGEWRGGFNDLQEWFSLSRAAFLTLPRVLMEAMPDDWQGRMAALLREYERAFPNQPDIGTRVQITDADGRLIQTPPWIVNYRRPNVALIDSLRSESAP